MNGVRAVGRAQQFAYQLRAVGEHHRAKLGAKPPQGFLVVGDRLAFQHIGRDAPLHVLAQRRILKDQERLRRRQHTYHDATVAVVPLRSSRV